MNAWPFNKLFLIGLLSLSVAHAENSELFWRVDNSEESPLQQQPSEVIYRDEAPLGTGSGKSDFDAMDYYTGEDDWAWSIGYQIGGQGQNTLHFELKVELDDYAKHWVLLSYSSTSGSFESLSSNPQGTATTNSSNFTSNNQIPADTSQSNIAYGLGYGHRFRFLRDIIDSTRLFEAVGFVITYNNFTENFRSLNYSGFGLQSYYAVEHRLNSSLFASFKMTYHMAALNRAALDEGEPRGERSLSLGWLDFGASIGFYF